MKFAVVVIGYNRPKSMERLLRCLETAYYYDDIVDLIISIDFSGSDDVENIAESFCWSHGNKRTITYAKRQGLRKNIMKCGDLLMEYDAIIVFEDDIVPSPCFFPYVRQTVNKYCSDDRIAGISLYKHLWNVNVDLPFEPELSSDDVYFMQFAQSWGQVWMKKQWLEFCDWYEQKKDEPFFSEDLPSYVNSWPESSWLKYHIKFMVEKNKYFVYPYKALSTNCSAVGEHNFRKSNKYQIPILQSGDVKYRLPELSDSCIIYDAFFERVVSNGKIGEVDAGDVEFDIYGIKTNYRKRYVVSSKSLPYKKLCSYALDYRPHEANVLMGIEGDDFFLYDTFSAEGNKKKMKQMEGYEYYFRVNDIRETKEYKIGRILLKIPRCIKRFLGKK